MHKSTQKNLKDLAMPVLLSSVVPADEILSVNEQIINFYLYFQLTVCAAGTLVSQPAQSCRMITGYPAFIKNNKQ